MSEEKISPPGDTNAYVSPYGYSEPSAFKTPTPEELQQERETAEATLGATIDGTFTEHADSATTDDDGTERLTLFMPWEGGGRRGATVATLNIVRTKNDAGSTTSTLSFSAKGAWNNHAIYDQSGVHNTRRDDSSGELVIDDTHNSDTLRTHTAEMWTRNLAQSTPNKPALTRRVLGRVLGGGALSK